MNYVTPSPTEKPETVVMYGTSADKLDKKAVGDSFVFTGPGHSFTIHNVKVGKLHSSSVGSLHNEIDMDKTSRKCHQFAHGSNVVS